MNLIKSASVYRCTMPEAPGILAAHLEEMPFRELQPAEFGRTSFVPPLEAYGDLALRFEGGYAFAVRYDEKIVPASVTSAEAKKRISEIEAQEGRRLGRKERQEIRERVFASLVLRALVRTTVVTCFYLPADRLLVVPTTAKAAIGRVLENLVKVMGSLKATTIYVSEAKNGLTTRLDTYLEEGCIGGAFDGFSVGANCKLRNPDGRRFAFKLNVELGEALQGLREAISGGAKVEELELIHEDAGVTFRLSADFKIKGVGSDLESKASDFNDALDHWEHEASVQTLAFAVVVNDLCALLDYKEPVEDASDLV